MPEENMKETQGIELTFLKNKVPGQQQTGSDDSNH